MKRLFDILFKTTDELVGHWETSNEGGFQMLGGSKLDLKTGGTGHLVSWGYGYDAPFEYSYNILWERVDRRTIKIKQDRDTEFSEVSYTIEDYVGAYNFKYDKLYDPNYELNHLEIHGIWIVPGELYRRRT